MGGLRRLGDRLTVFGKVFAANGAIVAAGGVFGFWLAPHIRYRGGLEFLFVALGIAAVLGADYVLLVFAFRPLRRLQTVMAEIERGRFGARADRLGGDRLARELAEGFNLVLDRMEDYRRSVSARVLRALEDERRRLARELHDETSQALTSLLIQLDLLERAAAFGSIPAERIRQMRHITEGTLSDVHRIIFDLRPTILDDLGLEQAVRWYLNDQVTPAGLVWDLQIDGLPERMPEAVETVCFRIVQEALTNVLRHARAEHVSVSLRRGADAVQIEVRDDGQGFDAHQALALGEQGFGLAGMRERAALAGGRLDVESAPGQGTVIRAHIPLPEDKAA